MNKKIVPELFEKRTGVKYQNWIQAWSVTEKQKRKSMNMKSVIKTGLWLMCFVCFVAVDVVTRFTDLGHMQDGDPAEHAAGSADGGTSAKGGSAKQSAQPNSGQPRPT